MNTETKVGGATCGCLLVLLVLNATVGALTFDYSIDCITGKDLPVLVDVIAGTLLGEFTIPAAVICWVATLCGASTPFIGG